MMEKKSLLAGKRIAVIGGTGNLGGLLAKKLAAVESIGGVVATGRDAEKLRKLAQDFEGAGAGGLETSTDNVQAVQEADIVLLCVKPQQMKDVVGEIGRAVACGSVRVHGKLFVSVAAGVSLSFLERELEGAAIVRCMPNLCASIGLSQTAVATNSKNGEGKIAREMLSLLGKTYEVEEKQVAVWTSVCASGPAFLVKAAQAGMEEQVMLACMQKALCKEKFEKGFAGEIARKVLHATKKLMLSSEESGWEFVARVASKKGTTEAGLEAGGEFSRAEDLDAAFEAAKLRAKEIEESFA